MYEELKKSNSTPIHNSKSSSKGTVKANQAPRGPMIMQRLPKQKSSFIQNPIVQMSSLAPSSPDELIESDDGGSFSPRESLFQQCCAQVRSETSGLPEGVCQEMATLLIRLCTPYFIHRHIIHDAGEDADQLTIVQVGKIIAMENEFKRIRLVSTGESEDGIVYGNRAFFWSGNKLHHLEAAKTVQKTQWKEHIKEKKS